MKRLIAIMLTAVLVLSGAGLSYAQNTKAQRDRKARLEREIAQINKQLKENASKSSSALSSLTLIRKKISNRNELIAESDRQIRDLGRQISAKQQDIDVIQARFDTLSYAYNRLVKNAYKNRDSKVWYMYILASEDVGQAFRRLGYLRRLSGEMNTQARRIEETRTRLEAEQKELLALKSQAQEVRQARQKEVSALQKEESDGKKVVDRLKKEKNKYQKELDTKRRQVDALQKEIERIIRNATSGGGTTATKKNRQPIDAKLDAEFSKNKGKLPWPADGPVVEHYGQHYHPVYKNVKLPFCNGMSISLSPKTSVRSVFDGVVKQIVVMPGYNKCVLVQHGGYFSFYCKLGSVAVKAGDKIKTGDIIGTVDTLDGDTQLHFQIWKGTSPQNPESWLLP